MRSPQPKHCRSAARRAVRLRPPRPATVATGHCRAAAPMRIRPLARCRCSDRAAGSAGAAGPDRFFPDRASRCRPAMASASVRPHSCARGIGDSARAPVSVAPRPGQILSGPRQPLPAGLGELPKAPPADARPGAPRPGRRVRSRRSVPSIPASACARSATCGTGCAWRRTGRRRQPAASARETESCRTAGGAAGGSAAARYGGATRASACCPALPRLRVPECRRRPASPVPGRPIYTGPVRPGQPLMRGPGGPGGPGGSGGPAAIARRTAARGRPMHPTSRRCAPSRRRCRPIRAAAMRPNRERADRSPPRVGSGRGSSPPGVAPRRSRSSRRPSIAKSPSPKASR